MEENKEVTKTEKKENPIHVAIGAWLFTLVWGVTTFAFDTHYYWRIFGFIDLSSSFLFWAGLVAAVCATIYAVVDKLKK